jgi:hypothetical protein
MRFKHTRNAEVTAVCSDVPLNYTVDAKRARLIKIRSMSYEKQSVMPATHVQVGLSVLPAQLCLRQAAGACVGSGTPFS